MPHRGPPTPEETARRRVVRQALEAVEVALREGVLFIDLPDLLAGERDLFYDGVHFNEHGARRVARVVADTLRTTFVGPSRRPKNAAAGSIPY